MRSKTPSRTSSVMWTQERSFSVSFIDQMKTLYWTFDLRSWLTVSHKCRLPWFIWNLHLRSMIFHFLLIFEVSLLSVWWRRAFLSYTLNCMPFVRKPHCWIYPQSKVSWDIMLASWLYLLPLSTFWSDEVVLSCFIWVIAVIYVASFLICFVSLSR